MTLGVSIYLAWRAFTAGRELVRAGGVRTALEHKLWFDELYDAVFSRPAQAIAVELRDRFEAPSSRAASTRWRRARRRRDVRGAERPPADLRPRDHDLGRRPRPRLPGRALMLTTLLIVVPLVGALLVWIAPVSRDSTAGLALLVALAEVGLWLEHAELRLRERRAAVLREQEWFELGISYAVGLYGFSSGSSA